MSQKSDIMTIPDGIRFLVRGLFTVSVLNVSLSGVMLCQASHTDSESAVSDSTDLSTVSMDYEKPLTYALGSKNSALTTDFKSGSDGSIFIEMVSYEGPNQGFHVYALKPSGENVVFRNPSIDGLVHFSGPQSYFVTGAKTYILEQAEVVDPSTHARTGDSAQVVLVYDEKGAVVDTVRLEPGLNPVSVAAFPSGGLVVVSVDKLNQRSHLLRLDASGRSPGDLRLFDNDYGAQLGAGPDSISPKKKDYLAKLMAASQMLPAGDNILIVPTQTNLPLLEINEHGVVRSTQLSLPKGKTIFAVVPSTDGILHVRLGHGSEDRYAISDEEARNGKVTAYLTDPYIYDFSRSDGSLLRRVRLADGLVPICKDGSDFFFLTARSEDGHLQSVKGTVSR